MLTLGNMIGGGEDIENKRQFVHRIFAVQLRTAWGKSRVCFSLQNLELTYKLILYV